MTGDLRLEVGVDGGFGACGPDQLKPCCKGVRKGGLACEVAVILGLFEPCERSGAGLLRGACQVAPIWVVWFYLSAVFARSGAHARPDGRDQSQPRHGRAIGEAIAHGRDDEAGVAGGAVEGYAACGVNDARVGKPARYERDIVLWRHARHGFDMRGDVVAGDLGKERSHFWVGHTACNRVEGEHLTRAADHLMAAIEDADLHSFVIMHVRGEGRPDLVPIGASGAEVIFDDPLTEAFMRHGYSVLDAKLSHKGMFVRTSGRHDAIDHGIGEAAGCIDPICQLRIREPREGDNRLPQDCTIALKIVTAHSGERASTVIAADAEGGHDGAECSYRFLRVGGVMDDIGMGRIEGFGDRIDIVAAFGHGEGHDADIGLRHARDERGVTCDDRDVVDHRACDFGTAARGRQFDQGRHVVLRGQFLALRFVIGADARADNGPVLRQPILHKAVEVPRLVGAVEIAKADMDDAGCQGAAVIGGTQDTFGQSVKRHVGQGNGFGFLGRIRHQLIQFPPSTL